MAPQHKRTESDPHYLCEVVTSIINLVVNALYTVAGFLFLESAQDLWESTATIKPIEIGDYIFIGGSLVGLVLALRSLSISCISEYRAVKKCGLPMHDDFKTNEIMTSAIFALANLLFFVGSFCFFPRIKPLFTDSESVVQTAETWGAWLFVSGSFMFVIGAFYGSISLGTLLATKEPHLHNAEDKIYHSRKLGGLSSLLGSVLFVVGSFLYRPGFNPTCNHAKLNGSALQQCAHAAEFGTWCYIIGGFFFVVDSMFEVLTMWYEHEKHHQQDEFEQSESDAELIGGE